MRNIKELLQVMLDNQECFRKGLCQWVMLLWMKKLITNEEYSCILDFIDENKPEVFTGGYYWTKGDITPRIEWIKKHLTPVTLLTGFVKVFLNKIYID